MKLAVFDFDGTLLRVDSLPYLLSMWRKLGYSKHRLWRTYANIGVLYIRYKLGLNGRMTREDMKKTALQKFTRIFTGMSEVQIGTFFDQCTSGMMMLINKKVAAEISTMKMQGCHTVLLSGFYQGLLERVAAQLGIETVLGTNICYIDGIIDAKARMDIKTGIDKVRRIKEVFPDADMDNSCAYADSLSDLPLLELVGQPVAVAPDADLKIIAKQRKWRVINET